MYGVRVRSLQWAVGLYCASLGAMMVTVPHQFSSPFYAALQPLLLWWGGLFVVAGGALLGAAVLRPAWPWAVLAHLLAGMALVILASGLAVVGAWVGMLNYGVWGLGTVLAPVWQAVGERRRRQQEVDLFALLTGASAALIGVVALSLPDQFTTPMYDRVRPALQWYGLAFLGSGLGVIAVHCRPAGSRGAFWAAHLVLSGVLFAWLLAVQLPFRNWTGIAYYGGFGAFLALLPWLGPRLGRLDPASLRTRLALVLVTAAALPLTAVTAMDSRDEPTEATEAALQAHELLAHELAQAMADHVGLHRAAVQAVAAQLGRPGLPPSERQTILETSASVYPGIIMLAAYDVAGNPLAYSGASPAASAVGLPVFEEVRRARASALDAHRSPEVQRMVVAIGEPIWGGDGRLGGIVVGLLDAEGLTTFLGRIHGRQPDDSVRVYLVDRDGEDIAATGATARKGTPVLSGNPAVARLLAGEESGALSYATPGWERLAAFARVPEVGWGVVVDQPAVVALAHVRDRLDRHFLLLLAVVGTAATAGILGAGWLTSPLSLLTRAAGRLAAGDPAVSLPRSSTTEVSHLAIAFGELRSRLAARTAERDRAEDHLRAMNAELELRVAERTGQLERAHDALQQSETRFRRLAENAQDIIYRYRIVPTPGVEYISPAATAITGYPPEDFYANPNLPWRIVHPEDRPRLVAALRNTALLLEPFMLRWVRKDGAVVWLELRSMPVYDARGKVTAVEGVARDISVQKQLEHALAYQALHDPLTGLANRTLFLDRLRQALLLASRGQTSLALLIVDLDGFKAVNDLYGHMAGDALLQETARRLEQTLRESDTVARIGGDEFAVVLPQAGDAEGTTLVTLRLLAALAAPIAVADAQVSLGASIGIALFPQHGDDSGTLMQWADRAMYTAKRAGGGYCLTPERFIQPAEE